MDGIAAYKAAQYVKAIDTFKKLTDKGIVNAKLYYNLGNAYLKANDLGNAILWYERAAKLDGNDPDLQFNLSHARSLTKDEDGTKGPLLYRILFFWKYQLSHQTIIALALICNAVFWILLLLRLLIRSKKRVFGVAAVVVILPTMIFISTALYNFYETYQTPNGVILPEKVSVRSGFGDHATELFVLHAGTVVTIQKIQKNFLRISYSKDKIGWIKRSQAGMI
jgi:tetratricopeptide (TPR) repeat protein